MKKVLKSTFVILVISLLFIGQDSMAIDGNRSMDQASDAGIIGQEEEIQISQASLFPFIGENQGFPMEISKSNLLVISIILSIAFFVFAHKNNFETDIYAFYHSNRDGSISFESIEQQQTFEFRSFLAKTFRILGILTAFTSVIMIIL
jgi:hypothetical protein